MKFYLDLYLPLSQHIQIDARVAAMLIVFSILSAAIFGLVPALQAARAPAQEALREGTAAAGTSSRQRYLRDALVVGEISLSLLLLISAGLLLRSLLTLRSVPLGFVRIMWLRLLSSCLRMPASWARPASLQKIFAGALHAFA